MVSKATSIGFLMMLLGFGVTYFIMTGELAFDDFRLILLFLLLGVMGLLILTYKWKRR